MSRVHRVFHRLEPITVELRLDENFPMAVFSEPDVEIGNQRRRQRPEVGPVEPNQFLHRISLLLHRQVELAFTGLRRSFKTTSLGVVKPAMVRTGYTARFDAAIRKRRATVLTPIVQ